MNRIFLRAAVTIPFLALPLAAQTTWYVDLTNPPPGSGTLEDPYASIQYAIEQPTTLAGDTVDVLPGTYYESVDLRGKSLVLVGDRGAELTILDARDSTPVLRLETEEGAGTRVEGFTIQHGRGIDGDDMVTRGGGLRAVGSQVEIVSCTFRDHYAQQGGGLYLEGATVRIVDCRFLSNICGGGGFAVNSTVLLIGTTIRRQRDMGCTSYPAYSTSAFRATGSTIVLDRCTIEENMDFAGFGSGASGLVLTDCASTILDSTFARNGNQGFMIDQGGAILVRGGSLDVSGCAFEQNWNEYRGGAIALYGAGLEVSKCVFRSNESTDSYWGGAIYVDDETPSSLVAVHESVFSEGYSGGGSALWLGSGTATVGGCSFEDNVASACCYEEGAGAGIWVHDAADLQVDACVFRGNAAEGGGGPAGKGAGIHVQPTGTAIVHRSTFFRNVSRQGWSSATDHARGGAVSGPAHLQNCTLYGNVADSDDFPAEGGGAYGATLNSCIVWANVPDALGGGALADWSAIEKGWRGEGNIDLEPGLWHPAFGDFHLARSSPCIDTGDPARYDEDGTRVDMGAEPYDASFCGGPFTYCWANESSEGCTPSIGWTGTAAIGGPDDFHVTATMLPAHQFGMLIWSTVARELPFFDGVLCVGPPVVRTAIQDSGAASPCQGRFDFQFTLQYMHQSGLLAGDVVFAQYWYRDPGGASGAGLTNALKFMLCASSNP